MSCYGTRTTDLFSLTLERIINFDDYNVSGREFFPRVELRLTVLGREATVDFIRNRRQHRYFWRGVNGGAGIPKVGSVDWNLATVEPHRYSGDYTESLEERRKAQT